MQAIILAGGFGTRLKSVIDDLPKPMAPISNKPFLAYLLDYLQVSGVDEVVLSLHYHSEKIQQYFNDQYQKITIEYLIEEEPLGTGGAIKYVFDKIEIKKPVFILNGDTFIKLNYQAMFDQFQQTQSQFSMALRSVENCSRYGKVIIEKQKVIQFQEKGIASPGYINAGVYLINPEWFSQFQLPKKFSFENEFLFPFLHQVKPTAFIAEDYFIDIGIPEDYARAQIELLTC